MTTSVKHEDQIRNFENLFFDIHMTCSHNTRIFRKTGRNKRNSKIPCVKDTVSFPRSWPDLHVYRKLSWYQNPPVCGRKQSLLWGCGDSWLISLFTIPLESQMYKPACRLVQNHIIAFHVFERTSLGILATSQNMFALYFDSNRNYFLIKTSLLLSLKLRCHIRYLFITACYHKE